MRIAILQFSPTLGAVPANLSRADALLSAAAPRLTNLDLLVLPELAFTGYNYGSLAAIRGVLEERGKGPSAEWARKTARSLGAVVCVGYAEREGEEEEEGKRSDGESKKPDRSRNYNALLTVSPAGEILAHYRKTHLYPTDETWAAESPSGWLTLPLPILSHTRTPSSHLPSPATTQTAFAICMDLNPYRFLAPPRAFELATHVRDSGAELLVCSMAWLSPLGGEELFADDVRGVPDLRTVGWWVERLGPLWRREGGAETVVVLANRSGEEEGGKRYAGSSCVVGMGGEEGGVRCWGWMGRGVEGVLVVDTGGEAGWRIGGGGKEGLC